jgi:hypothetical protein
VSSFGSFAALYSTKTTSRTSDLGEFSVLFAHAKKNPESLLNTRTEREGARAEFDFFAAKAIAPRYKPVKRKISEDAIAMIVAFEVSNKVLYERRYQKPVWPHGKSGVTIGIGYDVGYAKESWLREDWGTILSKEELDSLAKACTITGRAASALIPALSGIQISWDNAEDQFINTTLSRFIAETMGVLPNASKLSDDSLGALVSLDYNRGPSFKAVGDRYVEMRNIRRHLVNEEFYKIPNEIRCMGRLWAHTDVAGLVTRRNLEAALFERGLKS